MLKISLMFLPLIRLSDSRFLIQSVPLYLNENSWPSIYKLVAIMMNQQLENCEYIMQ